MGILSLFLVFGILCFCCIKTSLSGLISDLVCISFLQNLGPVFYVPLLWNLHIVIGHLSFKLMMKFDFYFFIITIKTFAAQSMNNDLHTWTSLFSFGAPGYASKGTANSGVDFLPGLFFMLLVKNLCLGSQSSFVISM